MTAPTTLPIVDILVEDRSRKILRNIDSLARSITGRGLLHPIPVREVDGAYVLVCGQRRIEACRSLGWPEIPVHVIGSDVDELEALYAEGEENTEREPFTPAEAVEHRRRIREVEARAAKARTSAAGRKSAPGRPAERSSNLDEVSPPKPHESTTRHRTAKATGYSASTLDKAEEITEAAEDETQPEPVREAARTAVASLAAPGAKVDREFKRFKSEQAKANPDVATANYRRELTRRLSQAGDLELHSPARVVEVADADLFDHIDSTCKAIAAWHASITELRGSGLRVVPGGGK